MPPGGHHSEHACTGNVTGNGEGGQGFTRWCSGEDVEGNMGGGLWLVRCWCFPSSPWKWDSSRMGKPETLNYLLTPSAPCPLTPTVNTHHVSSPLWNNILVRQQDCGLHGGMLSRKDRCVTPVWPAVCIWEIFITSPPRPQGYWLLDTFRYRPGIKTSEDCGCELEYKMNAVISGLCVCYSWLWKITHRETEKVYNQAQCSGCGMSMINFKTLHIKVL